MTPSEFCYWLQGHLEIGGAAVKQLDEAQTKMIREHLGYVFASGHGLTPEQIRALELPAVDGLSERMHRGGSYRPPVRLC